MFQLSLLALTYTQFLFFTLPAVLRYLFLVAFEKEFPPDDFTEVSVELVAEAVVVYFLLPTHCVLYGTEGFVRQARQVLHTTLQESLYARVHEIKPVTKE